MITSAGTVVAGAGTVVDGAVVTGLVVGTDVALAGAMPSAIAVVMSIVPVAERPRAV